MLINEVLDRKKTKTCNTYSHNWKKIAILLIIISLFNISSINSKDKYNYSFSKLKNKLRNMSSLNHYSIYSSNKNNENIHYDKVAKLNLKENFSNFSNYINNVNNTKNDSRTIKKSISSKFSNFVCDMPNKNTAQFQQFTLKNGISVLIVKDDKFSSDGISLTVNTGSVYDKDIFGLAHFTEHMLFLGSKKYPNENTFVDHVTQHNGKFNGYTATDRTGFFFKIHKDYFEKGVDIFSQFFIEPLFDPKFIEKEVNAVNSEYERNCQQDGRKKDAVIKRISNPNSILYPFRTGNTNTLLEYSLKNNIDLKERVANYYVKFFKPKNFKLIMIGSKPIAKYKEIANKYFGNIKNKKPETFGLNPGKFFSLDWKYPKEPAFEMLNVKKLVFMETVNDHKEFEINFLTPDIVKMLPSNPALYFKTLINFQGPGSLVDNLRNNGYISSLKSQARGFYSGLSGFKISGYITEIGLKSIDKILLMINAYINFLKKQTENKSLYEKIKEAYDKQFHNKKPLKSNLMKSLKQLGAANITYKPKYILSQTKILSEYNKQALLEYLDYLKIENSIIIIGNKNFDIESMSYIKDFVTEEDIKTKSGENNSFFNNYEPHLKTKFREFRVKDSFIEKIKEQSDYRNKNFGEDFNINIKYEEENDDEGDYEPDEEDIEKSLEDDKKTEQFLISKQTNAIYSNKESQLNENNKTTDIETKLFKTLEVEKDDYLNKKNKVEHKLCLVNKANLGASKVTKKLLKKKKKKCIKKFKKEGKKLKPVTIVEDQSHKIILKTDRSFLTNRVNLIYKVVLPFNLEDKKMNTILRLFVFAINLKIRNFFKGKNLGPNEITLKVHFTGFIINISGFSSTIKESFLILINGIKNMEINEKEFILVKDEMQKQFDGTVNMIPKLKAVVNFFSLILKHYNSGAEILEYLKKITDFAEINNIYKSYLTNSHSTFFFHGDIDKTTVIDIIDSAKSVLNLNNFDSKYRSLVDLTNDHYDIKGSFVFRELLINDFNYDHATVNFYKIGENNFTNLIKANLIKSIVGHVYFTELRIKEQLGYSTSGKLFIEGKNLYYAIIVQGSRVEPHLVDEKIENVVNIMRSRVLNVSKKKYTKFVKSTKKKLKLKDKSLKNRTEKIWNKINLNKNDYDEKKIVKKLIKKTQKQDIVTFFDSVFTNNIGKISIQEFSKNTAILPTTVTDLVRGDKIIKSTLITDIHYFRSLR